MIENKKIKEYITVLKVKKNVLKKFDIDKERCWLL